MSDYSRELSIAKNAAKKAASIINNYQEQHTFSVNYKGLNDLVTDADVAAEKAILETISEAFPDDEILAEESSSGLSFSDSRTWLIDPIDGTTNFAHGFPVYCVSIGLWEHGKPKMGLVLEVNREEFFWATTGNGACLNGNRISVSSVDKAAQALVATGFPYNDLSLMESYLRFFRFLLEHVRAVRRPGAASYDLCCVAAGRFDGFYEYALNPWDVGAAALIVQEAGGIVTDWQAGGNWLFGKRIVAGNKDLHKFLLDSMPEYFSAEELTGSG